jgi:hypothetical protein
MPEFQSNSVYIDLKGKWSREAFESAKERVTDFLNSQSPDDCGEIELSNEGLAYGYDCDRIPDLDEVQSLSNDLGEGSAWVIRVEEGDELHITNYVSGPGLDGIQVVHGDISDPALKLSEVGDAKRISVLRAAKAVGDTDFRVTND